MFCHITAMPPLAGSKNEPPRFRSISSITSALANTGVASSTSSEVTSIVQQNIGIRNMVMPGARMLKMVVMKFTAPRIEEVPTSSRATIHRSAPRPVPPAAPTQPCSDSGGYSVQPAQAVPPTR
jgi:hypothetical protein